MGTAPGGTRPIDLLVSEWAAPALRAAGFARKHRVFTATGEHGVHLRIEFRLHPLLVSCDTFWFEWTPSSPDDRSHLASRVPIPPALCADPDYTAVLPPEYAMQGIDLWRVGPATVTTYGPMLADQVRRFLPYWQQILTQSTPRPPDEAWLCTRRLSPPRTELANIVLARVVEGRAESVATQIRQLAAQYPNNAWTIWWRSLLPQ